MNIDNNNEWIYVYPDYNINTVCGSGGTVSGGGIYEKGATAMLEAIPSEGYIFDGWYENGNQLYQIAEEYVLTVSENINLEARFKENDLTISSVEVFGDLLSDELVTFTVNVTGGVQPLSFDYCIVKNNSTIASGQGLLVNMFEWTPTETGEYTVTISTEDLSGEVVITNVVVNIN